MIKHEPLFDVGWADIMLSGVTSVIVTLIICPAQFLNRLCETLFSELNLELLLSNVLITFFLCQMLSGKFDPHESRPVRGLQIVLEIRGLEYSVVRFDMKPRI